MQLISSSTTRLAGTATIPGSKSHTVRALLIATMAKGVSRITHGLESDDSAAAIDACRALGAHIDTQHDALGGTDITITSDGIPFARVAQNVFTRNSGITTNFLLPMLGLRGQANVAQTVTLDCGEQMKQRPIGSLVKAVQALGMQVDSVQGGNTCPLGIHGMLLGGKTTVDGSTSQFISALLMTLPLAQKNSVVIVHDLKERPYVRMTCRWLDQQDIQYEWKESEQEDTFIIPGKQHYTPYTLAIPADFSSASYIIAAAVMIPGEVVIPGLDMQDSQGDKALIPILQQMGADITIGAEAISIRGCTPLHGTTIDCNDIPDLVPTLAVIGTYAKGTTRLINAAHARKKETDRIESMYQGLHALGARITATDDGMEIRQSTLHGAHVHGYNDHRTVMALAVAGMIAEGTTTIDTAEAINKTFPTFISLMTRLGARITTQH